MESQTSRTLVGDDTLARIQEFLADDMHRVEAILHAALETESELIREVGRYIAFTGGKKLRPMLTLLAARTFSRNGGPPPVEVAAAVELIHVATLLHDDVIDKAEVRRGRPSVNARWGDEVAILMADYLYAHAFDLALTNLRPEVMRMLCKVTQRMCEGEMFQLRCAETPYSIDDYLHVVERKTGSLFSACMGLGTFLAGRRDGEIAAAVDFGRDFGIAFQITDDALDYVARSDKFGKEIGMDVSGGRHTLPLLLALEQADDEDRAWLQNAADRNEDFDLVVERIRRCGGIERALDEARRYGDRAAERLGSIEPTDRDAFELLLALPAYVVHRAY